METMLKKFLVGLVEDNATNNDCPLFMDQRFMIEVASYEEFHQRITSFCDFFGVTLKDTSNIKGMYLLTNKDGKSVTVTGSLNRGEANMKVSVVSF